MPIIKAEKIPVKGTSISDAIAQVCLYYPQYTFKEAQKLPDKRVRHLLLIAEKERARFLYDLTLIVDAPHTKKKRGVKKMLQYFKKVLDK